MGARWYEVTTVKEVLDLAVECDMSGVAHHAWWAITQQGIKLQDDIEKLKSIPINHEAINQLVTNNALGIGRIKLFVIKAPGSDLYAFYLAEQSIDATMLHNDKFGRVEKVTNATRLFPNKMLFADTGVEMTLFEYRKKMVQFPAYLGHARAKENVLYRLGV